MLKLSGRFVVTTRSLYAAMIEFACNSDREELIRAREIYTTLATLRCFRWHPKEGTVHRNSIKPQHRWIYVKGIPTHLWTTEVYELIVSHFGKFKEAILLLKKKDQESIFKFLIEGYNVACMPPACTIELFGNSFPVFL